MRENASQSRWKSNVKPDSQVEDDEQKLSSTALLLIDVINDFAFPEAEQLLPQAIEMAAAIKRLKERAKQLGLPAIYVNDNFGRWQSDFRAQVEHCLACAGREIVQLLKPEDDDYFILKPMHSGFYSTSLEVLLRHLKVTKLILTGVAADICVLFTGNDAYMRGYQIVVPEDCVAANLPDEKQRTLQLIKKVLKAEVRPAEQIDLLRLREP